MSSDKLISKLTEEELLEHLKNTDKEKLAVELDAPNDILLFCSNFEIEPGNHLIPRKLIWDLYKRWSKVKLSRLEFDKSLSFYVPSNAKCYLINKDRINISKYLFNYLKKQDKTINPKNKIHFENFLKRFEIQSGKYWVGGEALLYLYDKWSYSMNKRVAQFSSEDILGFSKLYFKMKSVEDRRKVFALDKSILKHISKEELNQLQEGVKCKYEKKDLRRKKEKDKST